MLRTNKPNLIKHTSHFSKAHIVIVALIFGAIGGFAIYRSFAAGTINIPTYDWTLTPNYTPGQDDPSSDYQAIWIGNPGTESINFSQQDEYWFAWNFYIDPSWDPAKQGNWGRLFNFHNTSSEPEGFGWDKGPGNSATAIDYRNGNLILQVEPEVSGGRDYIISPNMQKGAWHSLLGHYTFGRTDGTTAHPGRVQLWFDGSNTPLDTGNISNIWRFGPGTNGAYYNQTTMWVWTGFYTQNIADGTTLKGKTAYVRLGHTLAEALADNTGGTGGAWALSNIYNGLGTGALGPATYSQITSRTDADFQVPTSLGGSGGGTPAPTVSLSASPSIITSGASSTLTWNSTNATSCTASNAWSGAKATSGTQSVSPTATSTYSLSCTGPGGSTSANTTITVNAATSPKPTIPTNLKAVAGDKQVTLTWNANPSSDNVDTYQVYEADLDLNLSIPSTQTSYVVTKDHLGNSLVNGTSYSFRVSAHNNTDYGDWSTTAVSATPAAPAGSIQGDLNNDGHVTISDLSILMSYFGTTNTSADINKDGSVNITDLSILLTHYGT